MLIRFRANRATAHFLAAMNATLTQWVPVAGQRAGPTGPVNPTRLPPRGVLLAAAMVVSMSAGYFGSAALIERSISRRIQADRAIGVPGYYTYGGPHGKLLQVGAPFGRPCKPIVVRFEDSVPAAPYQTFVDVVSEARAAGVNITITKRDGAFLFSDLYPPGHRMDTVQLSYVFADDAAPTRLGSGAPGNINYGWDAALSPDRQHEYVTDVNITLHLSALKGETAAFRKAALGFVGMTQGIRVSTSPGSAFATTFAAGANRFSAQDVKAMLTMSGCAPKASPTQASVTRVGLR